MTVGARLTELQPRAYDSAEMSFAFTKKALPELNDIQPPSERFHTSPTPTTLLTQPFSDTQTLSDLGTVASRDS